LERRTGAYPDEVAKRLILMFSVKGETILDPFLGSGTTVKVAIENDRNSIAYEADCTMLPIIKEKIERAEKTKDIELSVIKRSS
jgi:modification methylase